MVQGGENTNTHKTTRTLWLPSHESQSNASSKEHQPGLSQVPTQIFLVTCRKGFGNSVQGKAIPKQALNACMWDQATSFLLETQHSAFKQGECGGAQRGRWNQGLTPTEGFPTDFSSPNLPAAPFLLLT